MSEHTQEPVTFRDRIATADEKGKRNWIYPKKPSGKFHNYRLLVATILLGFFFGAPFIDINGYPMLQFNFIDRMFIFFGVVFWPQDFFIFAIAALVFLLMIVSFTSIFGRFWCGWACPQTIFMEVVFRKIEFFIEGDGAKQKLLDQQPLSAEKIFKKLTKHGVFFFISFLIANTFLAYIIGKDALIKIITEPVSMHLSGLISLTTFSFVFYAVYARFREQACTIVCPYGRFQSVLVDDRTVAVTYDFVRGEPRGFLKKEPNTVKTGDCVDCKQCVRVCPTGIDIRNGIQLECVNCTACIDACDDVMTIVGKPKGLIRYASNENIVKGTRFHLNIRNIAYITVLTVLTGVLISIFLTRKDFDILILRQPGIIYQQIDATHYSNLYNLKLSNKRIHDLKGTLQIMNIPARIQFINDFDTVSSQELKEFKLFIIADKKDLKSGSNHIELLFTADNGDTKTIKTEFISP